MSSEDGNDVRSRIDKIVLFNFLLNEFIYANEGKPREIAQVVDVTHIIMEDYTYISIMSDYIMYGKSSMIF